MKRLPIFILVLLLGALLAGWLMAQITFAGKAGIAVFYREYTFLKTWWLNALLVCIVWVVLFTALYRVQNRFSKFTVYACYALFLLGGISGLWYSYYDFTHDLSHRWLGAKFHTGVYLFWAGWISIAGYLMLRPFQRKRVADTTGSL